MKTLLLCAAALLAGLTAWSQALTGPMKSYPKIDTSRASRAYWEAWHKDLYEASASLRNDTMRITPEVRRTATDEAYRRVLYPAKYTWPTTIGFIDQMELKKAFWYLINLYAADTVNRKLVLQSVFVYDQIMDMEKILTSTFYSYAPFEPTVCQFKQGRPVITRPDLLEKKMQSVKELVVYVRTYREQKKKGAPSLPANAVARGQQPRN